MIAASWIGSVSFLIWVYLFTGRGRFWQVPNAANEPKVPLISSPRVAVVVPARNEAEVVGQAVRSLLEQDYSGQVLIFVVDDHSSDETANVSRRAASDKAEQLTISLASSLLTIFCSQMRTSSTPPIALPRWLHVHRGITSTSCR